MEEITSDQANKLVEDNNNDDALKPEEKQETPQSPSETVKLDDTNEKKEDLRDEEFSIGVSEPDKHGDNVMNSFHTYTISVKTSHPNFRNSEFSVVRRYSDFEWLRSELAKKFRGVAVPPLPEKAVISRLNKEFVTYRRKELERFLKRIVSIRVFLDAEEVKAFFDPSEDALLRAKQEPKKQQSKGFMAMFTEKVTSVQAMVGKAEEVDGWFDIEKTYINNMELQLQSLLNRATTITKKGRDLNQAWAEFSLSTNLLAATEEDQDKVLSNYYAKLTEVSNQISALEKELAENEVEYFEDSIRDYLRIITSVKDLLANRSYDLWFYQSATKTRESKQLNLDRVKNTPKEAAASNELKEAQTKEEEAKTAFDNISASSRSEIAKFMKNKNSEMGASIRRLVQTNMNHHLRVVDLWKELLQTIEDAEEKANSNANTNAM